MKGGSCFLCEQPASIQCDKCNFTRYFNNQPSLPTILYEFYSFCSDVCKSLHLHEEQGLLFIGFQYFVTFISRHMPPLHNHQ